MQAGGKDVAAPHGHWGRAAKAKGGTGSVAAKSLDPDLDLDPNGARGPGEESCTWAARVEYLYARSTRPGPHVKRRCWGLHRGSAKLGNLTHTTHALRDWPGARRSASSIGDAVRTCSRGSSSIEGLEEG